MSELIKPESLQKNRAKRNQKPANPIGQSPARVGRTLLPPPALPLHKLWKRCGTKTPGDTGRPSKLQAICEVISSIYTVNTKRYAHRTSTNRWLQSTSGDWKHSKEQKPLHLQIYQNMSKNLKWQTVKLPQPGFLWTLGWRTVTKYEPGQELTTIEACIPACPDPKKRNNSPATSLVVFQGVHSQKL